KIGHVEAVLYDGMLVAERPTRNGSLDDLFLRIMLRRTQRELDEFGRELTLVVNDMANQPSIYRNRQWQGCWDCGMESLCLAEYRQKHVDYIRRTEYTQREDN